MKNENQFAKIKIKAHELDLQQPLGRFLITLFRQFEDELIATLKNKKISEISITDLNVLRFVEPNGSSVSELAERAGVSKQAMSKQAMHLESRGLVTRVSHPLDQRSQLICFTARGQKIIEICISAIQQIEARYEKQLGKGAYLQLKESLIALIV